MVENCCATCKTCLSADTCWSTPAPTHKDGPTEWQKSIMENVLNPAVGGITQSLADAALDWARGKFNKEVKPERPEHHHGGDPVTPPHPHPPSPDPEHHHPHPSPSVDPEHHH